MLKWPGRGYWSKLSLINKPGVKSLVLRVLNLHRHQALNLFDQIQFPLPFQQSKRNTIRLEFSARIDFSFPARPHLFVWCRLLRTPRDV